MELENLLSNSYFIQSKPSRPFTQLWFEKNLEELMPETTILTVTTNNT